MKLYNRYDVDENNPKFTHYENERWDINIESNSYIILLQCITFRLKSERYRKWNKFFCLFYVLNINIELYVYYFIVGNWCKMRFISLFLAIFQ